MGTIWPCSTSPVICAARPEEDASRVEGDLVGLFDDLVRLGDQVRVFDDFALLGFLKPRILKCPPFRGGYYRGHDLHHAERNVAHLRIARGPFDCRMRAG